MKTTLKMPIRYGVEGFFLGLVFPLAATFADSYAKSRSFWEAQAAEPLLWIIDIAPIMLGITAAFIGKWRGQSEAQLEELKRYNDELRIANEELIASRNLKNQFMANISHELRTPLNAIIGFARLTHLKTKDIISPRQVKNLERIQDAGTALLYLVNDILDIERLEAGVMRLYESEVDLVRLFAEVEEIVKPIALEKNLELIFHPPEIKHLWTDAARLSQIVTNLSVNAIKYSDEGTIAVRAFILDEQFIISVSDEGIGIEAEEIGTIFEPFRQVDGSSTRAREGVGLGLNLVSKLTTLLKGEVAVESELGIGSTFKVSFPLNKKSAKSRSEGISDFGVGLTADPKTINFGKGKEAEE